MDLDAPTEVAPAPIESPPPEAAIDAYRAALGSLPADRLAEIARGLGEPARNARPSTLVGFILDHWTASADPGDSLDRDARTVLGLMALTDSNTWPVEGLNLALGLLGVDTPAALARLEGLGIGAVRSLAANPSEPERREWVAHPAVIAAARVLRPEGPPPAIAGPVRQIRETDGLELILRLGALWQVLHDGPLRQTQQGTLYKRDRDRLEDDAVLAGPIADALEPLPDFVPLLLDLALGVGLAVEAGGGERIESAPAEFWSEHAVHLPHILASRWLGLRRWHEHAGYQREGAQATLALPFVRPVVMLWLATIGESDWVAIDDIAEHLRAQNPGWVRPVLGALGPSSSPVPLLESMLLGGAYQIGLIRAAEEVPSGRRVVQLTALGRYVLSAGAHPEPRPHFPHFLFVQPNFEIIAYRQGLNPALVGVFSRFARWTKIGAALELKLTAESVYMGLEGGLKPAAMLDRLTRHSARPLPSGVAEALKTWAGRRDRVTYYSSATLVEFADGESLELALGEWPATEENPPVRVSDRLLLVEDERSIPYARFRLAGSRDYRRAAEICIEIEADGIGLALDVARSDLFIDAEILRFADELPKTGGDPRRRFRVSRGSLARAVEDGLTAASLSQWFLRRAGTDTPPATRLLLQACEPNRKPLVASRPIVLQTPSADWVDGLLQHPDTAKYLGDRLGPSAILVPEAALPGLKRALDGLGLPLKIDEDGRARTGSPAP